jgi:hypothetical protein
MTSQVLGPQLTLVGDPGEGMSSKAGPVPNSNPCDAKDCDDRPESVESPKTQGP